MIYDCVSICIYTRASMQITTLRIPAISKLILKSADKIPYVSVQIQYEPWWVFLATATYTIISNPKKMYLQAPSHAKTGP